MPKYQLSDLDLDEVSLVISGDDPDALVVLHKSEPEDENEGDDDEAPMVKAGPLGSDFRYPGLIKARRKRGKRPPGVRHMMGDRKNC